MTDFLEIDFIEAGDNGSGDAIAIRHRHNGVNRIYVVDGGYTEDGQKIVRHVREHYDNPSLIDHVVLTHSDADHASGLQSVLSEFQVSHLWMNRPWVHVNDLMPMFKNYQDRGRLISRLKRDFPKVAELEEIAKENGISINDAFRGDAIGEFTVLSPHRTTYLELIVESDKTPVQSTVLKALLQELASFAAWGEENLKGDSEGTTAENETSIVQFADVCGKKVLLTGDAGVRALTEAHQASCQLGKAIRLLDWFQAPHHGSRRNLSSDVLDTWLGGRLTGPVSNATGLAIISANQNDSEHPKKAVVRALIHRGRRVFQTSGTLHVFSGGAPSRGWSSATPLEYPSDQED